MPVYSRLGTSMGVRLSSAAIRRSASSSIVPLSMAMHHSSVYRIYPIGADFEALDTVLGFMEFHHQGISVLCWLIVNKAKPRFVFRGWEIGLAVLIDHTTQAFPIIDQGQIWHAIVSDRITRQGVTNIFEGATHGGGPVRR